MKAESAHVSFGSVSITPEPMTVKLLFDYQNLQSVCKAITWTLAEEMDMLENIKISDAPGEYGALISFKNDHSMIPFLENLVGDLERVMQDETWIPLLPKR